MGPLPNLSIALFFVSLIGCEGPPCTPAPAPRYDTDAYMDGYRKGVADGRVGLEQILTMPPGSLLPLDTVQEERPGVLIVQRAGNAQVVSWLFLDRDATRARLKALFAEPSAASPPAVPSLPAEKEKKL